MDKAIILLSMARMLRLCQYLTPLAHLFKVIKRLMPTYVSMCRLLMIVYFIFVVIGRMAFGGQIYNTNPVLAGSSFAHNQFWTMNFNDCCSGLVTLFVLMILNDWPTISQGYCLVTGSYLTSMFFVVFFVCCNLVVLNILMALILDCMGVMSDAIDKEDANENDLDGDFEKDAAGGGEKSAVAMLRMVLSSDKHEDSHEEPSGAGGSGYGTFGTAVSDPGPRKEKRAMSMDDIDLEHHGDTQSKFQQALHGKSKTFEDVDVHVLEAATAESDKYKETEAAAKVQSLLRGKHAKKGEKKKEQEDAPSAMPAGLTQSAPSAMPARPAAESPV